MISIIVHDEEFQTWLNSLEVRIHMMMQTLIDVAQLVEQNTELLVPYDYNKKWGGQHLQTTFKAVPTGDPQAGFIEVEMGYSSLNPRDNFDYADYTHRGVDWRTGNPLRFQKSTAQAQYLWKGMALSEKAGFREIETDYLSLFRG